MFLILATEERIDYKYDSGIGSIVAEYDTPEAAAEDIAKFTPEAVKDVKFYDDNESLLGEYHDLIFEGADIEPIYEEEVVTGYACTFHLRTQTDLEKRVGTLEDEMTEVQEVLAE